MAAGRAHTGECWQHFVHASRNSQLFVASGWGKLRMGVSAKESQYPFVLGGYHTVCFVCGWCIHHSCSLQLLRFELEFLQCIAPISVHHARGKVIF